MLQRNVFHVLAPTPNLTDDDFQFLHDAFVGWWTQNLTGDPPPNVFQASAGTWLRYLVYLVPQELPFQQLLQAIVEVNLGGASDFPPLPPNSTCAVQWITGFAGARGRGRTYFPWLAEINQDPDRVGHLRNDPAVTLPVSFRTLLQLFSDAANDTGRYWALVLLHKTPAPWSLWFNGFADTIVGTRMADDVLDSQYRRLPNHKRHSRD